MTPIRSIAIFGNSYQEGHLSQIAGFIRLAVNNGFSVAIDRGFLDYLESENAGLPDEILPFDTLPIGIGAAVSIGGDGTFLRTARRIGASGVPILGINTGHLGFLSHYSFREGPRLLELLKYGNARIESREVIKVVSDDLPADVWPYALNEVAVLKEDTSSMIASRVSVDGLFLADYLADGLLISTATGSTGYNLSVGGPIVQPSLDCLVIAPVAPHTLTMRPLVVGGGSKIELMTTSRAESYRLSLDGCGCLLVAGTTVRVERAEFRINVLLGPSADFASRLRNKLLWGAR